MTPPDRQSLWCFGYYRSCSLPLCVGIDPGAVTCRLWRWKPVVHQERTVIVTRFEAIPFGAGRALTFEDESGRVAYIHNMFGQHTDLVPALEAAGFVVSPNEALRVYPPVWIRRSRRSGRDRG